MYDVGRNEQAIEGKKQPQTIINDKKCSKTHKREAALDHMFCDINCKNVSSIDIKGSSLLFGQN